MAHNAYVRAGGVWVTHAVPTSAEFHTFDLRQFQAVNGDLGGTWAPPSPITIGGTGGLTVTGPFSATDARTITFVVGALTMQTGTTFNANVGSTVYLSGTTNYTGSGHHVYNGATFNVDSGGTIDVNSGGFLNVNGSASIKSSASLTVDVSGTLYLYGNELIYGTSYVQSGGAFGSTGTGLVELGGTTTFDGANHHILNGAELSVDGGGTLSLSGAGAGGTLSCPGGSHVNLGGATAISGVTTISGPTTISGATSLTGALTGSLASSVTLHGPLTCDGATTLGATTATSMIAVVSEATTLLHASATAGIVFDSGTTASLHGALNIDGTITRSGNSGYTNIRYATGSNGNVTIDARQFDTISVPAFTGNHTWKFSDLGASDRVEVIVESYRSPLSAFTLTLADAGGSAITGSTGMPFTPSAGCSTKLGWNGSSWAVVGKF